MLHSARQRMVLLAVLLCSTVVVGMAQDQQPKKVETGSIRPTTVNAVEMYTSYCAACHGPRGKGDGPAASELKTAPPDLTTLAKRNGGQFPEMRVAAMLRDRQGAPAHGSADMPVWGPLFSAVSGSNQNVINLRISNLTKYLESMQSK